MMFDTIIRNGHLIDGTGAPLKRGDVGISGDRIAAIENLAGAQAKTVIDATGYMVTPGFVDMHSHADGTLPTWPTADSLVHQGITTAVVGQCGSSPVPLLPETRDLVLASRASDILRTPWERL